MRKLLMVLAALALAAGCRDSSSSSLKRDQQSYGVVQEGSGGAVTSTINGPGEVPPPVAPVTGTNADTTSNLSLPIATTGTNFGQQGSLAGTMPHGQTGSVSMGYPTDSSGTAAAPVTATTPRTRIPLPAEPRIVITQTPQHTTTQSTPMTSATPSDTSTTSTTSTSEPSSSTDTTGTTPSEHKAKPKEKPSEPPPPPPASTDTSTTTPPPTST